MQRVILIRFGEIFLKGSNRKHFEQLLKKNIKATLASFEYSFCYSHNRYFVENYSQDVEADIVNRLTKVFGIHSVSPASKVPNTMEELSAAVLTFIERDGGSFRFTVNRADKTFPLNSPTLARELGGVVLSRYPEMEVDLFNPCQEIRLDLRENGYCYIFKDVVRAVDGLPVGCSGDALLLLSGGIDSPVAGYMMAKRGMRIHALHFHSEPYTNALARDKVMRLAKRLTAYATDIEVFVVPVTHIQNAIHEKCPEELMITILRRFMMRIASVIAKENKLSCIITGESLGQVASQTIESLTVTNALAEFPVLRPLIGMDKDEIIQIAQRIDTFDISIEPHQDCCTVFLPKNPAIHPKPSFVEKCESRLDIDELVRQSLEGMELVNITAG